LTGAYNRRAFNGFMNQAIEHAQKSRQVITLMVFDIDDFKTFNDRYGHPAGDQILRETVRLLRSVIRPGDRVCRIGGDEFAVIFYDAAGPRDPGSRPPEDVSTIAQRFQQQIREHRFPKLGESAPGTLTVSGGISTYPWDGRNVDELVQHADKLALDAKRAGKNAIAIGPGVEGR
jgi:two-component system, cell cycle response regulator